MIYVLLPNTKWKGDGCQMKVDLFETTSQLALWKTTELRKNSGIRKDMLKKNKDKELVRLRKDVAAKEQEVAALRASAEVKESTGRISPLWLIPTVFVTMAVTALMLVFVLKKKVYSNVK